MAKSRSFTGLFVVLGLVAAGFGGWRLWQRNTQTVPEFATVTVTPERDLQARLMVTDPLPAGLEIDNPNLLRAGDLSQLDWLQPTESVAHAEFREDRFVAQVDSEIRRFIAQYVADEIDNPASQQAQVIDVAERLDEAWTGV